MTAPREALVLPLTFLTVALLGGVRIGEQVAFVPPPPFALVLALLLFGALVSGGVLAPQRLMDPSRSSIENMNGLVVLLAVFAASAQAFNAATPVSGLPRVLFHILFLVLLLNTLAASAGRVHLLRSLLVIFGSAFTLKYVVLAALSDPAGGQMSRVLQAVFEGVTLGMVTQGTFHPATAYLAFFALVLFLFGLLMLPPPFDADPRGGAGLVRATRDVEKGVVDVERSPLARNRLAPAVTIAIGLVAGSLVTAATLAFQNALADDATRQAVTAVKHAVVAGHKAKDAAVFEQRDRRWWYSAAFLP